MAIIHRGNRTKIKLLTLNMADFNNGVFLMENSKTNHTPNC